ALVAAGAIGFAALAAWSEVRAFNEARKADAHLLGASVEVGFEGRQFRPRWANLAIFTSAPIAEILRGAGTASVVEGASAGTARAERRGPREFTLQTQSAAGATVVVRHFYYPGWQARLAANGAPLPTEPSRGDGLIAVRVPAGTHEITLRLEASALEKTGALVSALASMLLAVLFVRAPSAMASTAAARSAAVPRASSDPSQSSP
ncbi:MAG: hypothetical protein ACKVU1_00005, partial [bacterium]